MNGILRKWKILPAPLKKLGTFKCIFLWFLRSNHLSRISDPSCHVKSADQPVNRGHVHTGHQEAQQMEEQKGGNFKSEQTVSWVIFAKIWNFHLFVTVFLDDYLEQIFGWLADLSIQHGSLGCQQFPNGNFNFDLCVNVSFLFFRSNHLSRISNPSCHVKSADQPVNRGHVHTGHQETQQMEEQKGGNFKSEQRRFRSHLFLILLGFIHNFVNSGAI